MSRDFGLPQDQDVSGPPIMADSLRIEKARESLSGGWKLRDGGSTSGRAGNAEVGQGSRMFRMNWFSPYWTSQGTPTFFPQSRHVRSG
jgi:hypothetical protein